MDHTQCTCHVYVGTKLCTMSLECSPVDPPKNDSTNSRLAHDVLIRLQPYPYAEGELPQVKTNIYLVDFLTYNLKD